MRLFLIVSLVVGCGAAQTPPAEATTDEAAPTPTAVAAHGETAASTTDEAAPAPTAIAAHGETTASTTDEAAPTPTRVAGHDEVCRDEARMEVATCAAGLSCCYPCGIEGCAWVCHTTEECDMDAMRP